MTTLINITTLTTHYRTSNDTILCCDCARHSIFQITEQVGVAEPSKGYDPLECSGCSNLILTVEEAAAKLKREGK